MELELKICSSSGEKIQKLTNTVQAIVLAEKARHEGAFYVSIGRPGEKPDLEFYSRSTEFPRAHA